MKGKVKGVKRKKKDSRVKLGCGEPGVVGWRVDRWGNVERMHVWP